MTDWWANINVRGQEPDRRNFAAMARAQNDIYMVCADGSSNDDTTAESLENGSLARAELQRNAANICSFLMTTNAMKTLIDYSLAFLAPAWAVKMPNIHGNLPTRSQFVKLSSLSQMSDV